MAGAEKTVRIAHVQLFLDFLKFTQLRCAMRPLDMHALRRRGEGNCCSGHQYLNQAYDNLRMKAQELHPKVDGGPHVLSDAWWKELGFDIPESATQIID